MTAPAPDRAPRRTVSGAVRASGIATVAVRLVGLAALLVVAGEIGPRALGVVAAAMVVVEILAVFAEGGLVTALVQADAVDRRQRATLYLLDWVLGAAAFAAATALAAPLAALLAMPELRWAVPVAALSILLLAPARHVGAMLQREMDFAAYARPLVAQELVRAGLSVGLVLAGWGVAGVVAGHVAGAAALSAIRLGQGRRRHLLPGFALAFGATRPILAFGAWRAATVLVRSLGQRADQIVVGAAIGAVPLGHYRVAQQFTSGVLVNVQALTAQVTFAHVARVQSDPATVRAAYLGMTAATALVAVPVTVALALAGPGLAGGLLGPEWDAAGALMPPLAIAALARMHESGAMPVLNGLGHARALFAWRLAASAVLLATMVLSAREGDAMRLAVALAVAQTALSVAFYWTVQRPAMGAVGAAYLRALRPAALATAAALLPWAAVAAAGGGTGARLAALAAGGPVLVAMAAWLDPLTVGRVAGVVSPRLGARLRGGAP